MSKEYKISQKGGFDRTKFNTSDHNRFEKREDAEAAMAENLEVINELQQKLYGEKKEGVIFLFQAMDAAGKDGTIRAVLSCLSPHGVTEYAFKAPSATELSHDFLWRIAQCAPYKGQIAIFNRSHYEDVLVSKVHGYYKTQAHADRIDVDKILERRYKDICNYEEYLYHNSVRIVKIYLNLGKDEQARRFLSRIDEKEKNWKFSSSDVKERNCWEDYQVAFEDAINATATEDCPWYVVPADHKWYMRWLVSQIIRDTLEDMNPKWPVLPKEEMDAMEEVEKTLRSELPPDDPASKKPEKKDKKKKKDKKNKKD